MRARAWSGFASQGHAFEVGNDFIEWLVSGKCRRVTAAEPQAHAHRTSDKGKDADGKDNPNKKANKGRGASLRPESAYCYYRDKCTESYRNQLRPQVAELYLLMKSKGPGDIPGETGD